MKPVTDMLKNTSKLIASHRQYSFDFAKKQNLWTQDRTVISPYKSVEIPKINIVDYVFQNSLEKWPEKTALVCGITNQSYTFYQLYKYSRRLAAQLRSKLNVENGDEVMIMMPNSIDYPVTVFGVLQAGAAVAPVNPLYTPYEFVQTILSTNPKVIIGTQETFATIQPALEQAKIKVPVIIVNNVKTELPPETISYKELIDDTNVDESVLKNVKITGKDVAFLPFSSGTTGLPKQVELTSTNVIFSCINQNIDETKQCRETTNTHQDSVMAVLPFFHIFGLSLFLQKVRVGAKLVVLPKFQPYTFLESMKEQNVNVLYVVAPLVQFIGSNPAVKKEHMKSVQNMLWGAAPISQYELKKCLEKCSPDLKVTQLYGSTETSLVTSSVPGINNAGYAVRNIEMKTVNEDGNNMGPNEVGELLVRGPQIMSRYRNNPEATRAAFTDGNWFKTGDVTSIEEDGSLNYVDRVKELIKVKGYSVPPVEIENILKEHPAILDAAVIGVPDSKTGEAPKAFVVFKNGHKASEEDIKRFVQNHVTEYKRIKEVTVLDELPKNAAGKILRKDLKYKYC